MIDDKLIFENYLLVLKSSVEVYVHGTLESSNSDVRNELKHGLDETMKAQADTYDLMSEQGWYDVCNVDKKEIKKTLDKLNKSN